MIKKNNKGKNYLIKIEEILYKKLSIISIMMVNTKNNYNKL
jgi:hypothetical protein